MGLAEFVGANAGIEQKENDGAVAFDVGQAVGGGGALLDVCFGALQGVEHGADVGFTEWDDGAGLGLGALDAAQGVFKGVAFVDCPVPQDG